MPRPHALALLAALALIGPRPLFAQAAPGPALTVDVTADRHAISPNIYGMAYPDPVLAKEINLPVNRWGGDATTRYNWQIDASNSGDDWYFMGGHGTGKPPVPSGGPDALVADAQAIGGRVLLTIPIIDYINSVPSSDWGCSFPVSLFGPQQKTNPYVHPVVDGKPTNAGNGRKPDGTPITLTPAQILRTHTPNTPAFQHAWVQHLVGKFGPTTKGGVGFYELDNEPGGWNNTHRDIHPDKTGHDELVSRSLAYAAAVKSADPTAQIVGPGEFLLHYQNDGKPGDGKKEHNNTGQADYYLQKFAAYQKQHGTRLLDYFDEHYYPLHQDGGTDATLLESTRSLWDPTYVEKDWYGQYNGAINLLPNFHKWVDANYPGTKVSISEYGWGSNDTLNGALCQTDVLGIFGRERLDLACLFGPPKAAQPLANSFRLYRNYDGKGGQYGSVWVRSQSADQGRLAVYGAQRPSDHALTLIVINKTGGDLTSRLSLSHFASANSAQVYRYSAANLKAVVPQSAQALTPTGFSATYPANSVTLFVLPSRSR